MRSVVLIIFLALLSSKKLHCAPTASPSCSPTKRPTTPVPSASPTQEPSMAPNIQSNWSCGSYAFLPSVNTECINSPSVPIGKSLIRVKIRDMVDYSLSYELNSASDSQMYIDLVAYSPQVPNFIGIQDPSSAEFSNKLWGVAIDGVPIYSSIISAGVDGLSSIAIATADAGSSSIRVDRCGGTFGATNSDGTGVRYHYRAIPACILATPSNIIARRAEYISDVYELLDSFTGIEPSVVGYTLTGYPIYSPYNSRGLLQSGLDNCNGKFTNGSYGYYVTPTFPYIVGCYGPGIYVDTDLDTSPEDLTPAVGVRYKACPGGYYPGNKVGASDSCVPCPPGKYSAVSYTTPTVTAVTESAACNMMCPIGSYCLSASARPILCPGGSYGSEIGLKTADCSGSCQAGHFCPSGSSTPTAYRCGNSTKYCPARSASRVPVLLSFYSTPESVDESMRSGQEPCPYGSYCENGRRFPCPAGRFGATTNLVSSNCTDLCPKGHYCPSGTMTPFPCPAGSFGAEVGLQSVTCSGLCAKGHWCASGSTSGNQTKCAAGIFGSEEGLQTAHCSAICEPGGAPNSTDSDGTRYCSLQYCKAGYQCPLGSKSATEQPCGGADVYCPEGSGSASPVDDGYYTVGPLSNQGSEQSEDDEMYRTGERLCEPGFWCKRGKRSPCNAGYYSDVYGAVNQTCVGKCYGGFYCPSGSPNPRQFACGFGNYCPEGSGWPTEVPAGYYGIDGLVGSHAYIAICPPGSYCVNGVRHLCPAGRYSAADGAPSEDCDGLCIAGYYCLSGSVSATQEPCPAGRYGTTGSDNSYCAGECSPGYHCPAGSASSRQYECGGDDYYCPPGSGAPSHVNTSYYSTGGTSTTRHAQVKCVLSPCPSTTV